jgi:hypothetical protein
VLESTYNYINDCFHLNKGGSLKIGFNLDGITGTPLVKLHGTTRPNDTAGSSIIPPTWSKGIDETIRTAWKCGLELLAQATQLRIMGYSLPVADSYIKYLFKASVLGSQELKKIDVICMDDESKSARARYDDFIRFKFMRFRNADITNYLDINMEMNINSAAQHGDRFIADSLEQAHETFMDGTRHAAIGPVMTSR